MKLTVDVRKSRH